jgi:hypothetical protein
MCSQAGAVKEVSCLVLVCHLLLMKLPSDRHKTAFAVFATSPLT